MPGANETLVQKNFKFYPSVVADFRRLMEEAGSRTENQFMETLLEVFQNPREKPVPVKTEEQQKEVQELVNEIGRLKTAISLKDDRILELETEISKLETRNHELEADNQQLSTSNADGIKLEANQVIVTIPPKVAEVLKVEIEAAQKATKQTFTVADILLQSFWTSIMKGVVYPWKVWSNSEIAAIEKKLAAQPHE